MKILYISDRADGGIARHVGCLRASLPSEAEAYVIGIGGDEEYAGKSGHDLREWWQIRRVIKEFKPDIVHFHIPVLLMTAYVRFFTRLPIVRSWHTPTNRKQSLRDRVVRWLFGPKCYYLPVSGPTWEGLKKWAPGVKGEVFYNPLRISSRGRSSSRELVLGDSPSCGVVGMVGRNADQKDWPSFHKVESLVRAKMPNVEFVNGGEITPCDGRKEIARMDVFVMTSKHEELPTTLLECFSLGTAVCGFIPVGGVSDILQYSRGPLKNEFIAERDTAKLAEIAMRLLNNEAERQAVIEDGWQILVNHFDAEKNCHGQLMDIYRRVIAQSWKAKIPVGFRRENMIQ